MGRLLFFSSSPKSVKHMSNSEARRWYSPLDTEIEGEGERCEKLWVCEARDIARGFCGALFLALPLLYTVEMWERVRVMPAWDLALVVLGTYLVNVGFAVFNGFKADLARRAAWLDALTAMGIGLVASAITLLLIGRYSFNTPPNIMVNLLLLEMVPASFGASLAINQLGARTKKKSGPSLQDHYSSDFKKILATFLGATMFAFNIAPTVEPKRITYGLTWWHTLALVAFSLVVSYLMVFFARFVNRDSGEGGILGPRWSETVIAYVVSLAVSALLLWMFGYLTSNTPPTVAVAWIVTMGYTTTLGGAAGRLVL